MHGCAMVKKRSLLATISGFLQEIDSFVLLIRFTLERLFYITSYKRHIRADPQPKESPSLKKTIILEIVEAFLKNLKLKRGKLRSWTDMGLP